MRVPIKKQCEKETSEDYQKLQKHLRGSTDTKCRRYAHYLVDGKYLCAVHAGEYAVQRLLAANEIAKLE